MNTLFLLINAVALACGALVSQPANQVVDVGTKLVTMKCELAPEDMSSDFVSWYEYISDTNGKRVFVSSKPEQIENPNKFSIDGQYDLQIQDAQIADAGKYECQTFSDGNNYPAMLSVYEAPSCTYPEDEDIVAGKEVAFDCQVSFGGDTAPSIAWISDLDLEEDETTPANSVKATGRITLGKQHNGKGLICRVSSSDDSIPYAGNECEIAALDVKYEPSADDVSVQPFDAKPKKEFPAGTMLKAIADANPPAEFTWQGQVGNETETIDGATLTLTEEMKGSNSWTLTVKNTINEENPFVKTLVFEVSSAIVTTTSAPSTTTKKAGYDIVTTKKPDAKTVKPVGAAVTIVTSLVAIVTSLLLSAYVH